MRLVSKTLQGSKSSFFKCLAGIILMMTGLRPLSLKEALASASLEMIKFAGCVGKSIGVFIELQEKVIVEERRTFFLFFSKVIKVERYVPVAKGYSIICEGDSFSKDYGKLLALKQMKENFKLADNQLVYVNKEIDRLEEITKPYLLVIEKSERGETYKLDISTNVDEVVSQLPVKVFKVLPFEKTLLANRVTEKERLRGMEDYDGSGVQLTA